MMTKERFKDLVYMMLEHNELYDKLYDLGIDTIVRWSFVYFGNL